VVVSTSPTPTVTASPSATTSSPVTPSTSPSLTGYAALGAAQIVRDLTVAVAAASSVHYAGALDQAGNSVKTDITASRDSATGTVDFGTGRIDVLRTQGVLYIRAGAGVWRAQGVTNARALTSIVGKWVKLGAGDAARFRVFTDFQYLMTGFEQPRYAVTGSTPTNGVEAVQLSDATGTVLAVAVAAPHLPLAATSAAGRGSLTFSNWNAPVSVQTPVHWVDLAAS
jgi:hypothetical protein